MNETTITITQIHNWVVCYEGPDAWQQGLPEEDTEWDHKRSLRGVADGKGWEASIASFVGWTKALPRRQLTFWEEVKEAM